MRAAVGFDGLEHGIDGSSHGSGSSNAGSTHASEVGKQSPNDVLTNNTQLNSRLQKLLPSTMTPQQACEGFKNLGQCIAAIHVAHNLNISFDDLKTKMTGGESLGKAIQDIKPDANAKAEAKKGKKQANDDLSNS